MALLNDRTDKVVHLRFARFAESWGVDEIVTDDELEGEVAGAGVVRT